LHSDYLCNAKECSTIVVTEDGVELCLLA
jgi:hypothetical protein